MSQMFVVILVGSPKHGRLPAPPHEASWVLSCTAMRQMLVLESPILPCVRPWRCWRESRRP
jgi:hypothetical protein